MIRHLIAEAITLALLGGAAFILGSFALLSHTHGMARVRAYEARLRGERR